MTDRHRRRRSTPAGAHRPVLRAEMLECLAIQPTDVVVDGTLGHAGHAAALLQQLGPTGMLIGIDRDPTHLPEATRILTAAGGPFVTQVGNFAGLPALLQTLGLPGANAVCLDLGVSSMQIDDPQRGFSYMREGPLDMRMDPTRGQTAAQILTQLSAAELAAALRDLGDEPLADVIAAGIMAARQRQPIASTVQLRDLVLELSPTPMERIPGRRGPTPKQHRYRPVARVFQTLRLLVNRELASLKELLRVLPTVLQPGGRVGIISFHSGEDRPVKQAFREGLQTGVYAEVSTEPIRPTSDERFTNPRSRSAKLRWARRAQ